jgi:hypothetical protein
MNVLILNRIGLRHIPYAEILVGDRLFLISDADAVPDRAAAECKFERVECVKGYERSGRVEQLAVSMHREIGFDCLIAVSEFDLLRAGRLRDYLGIPGQGYASALAFRDKVWMKGIAQAAGIAVPAFRRVDTPLDLLSFVEEHGLSVVLKPTLGAGAMQTWLIHTPEDLDRVLNTSVFAAADVPSPFEVESFVPGTMYHVDGFLQDGRIAMLWPSVYLNPCHAYASGSMLASHTLAGDNPLASLLCEFVERLLAALPTPPTTGVHAEVFHTPHNDLVLCEIACRVGGPRIPDLIRTATGFDLVFALVRGQAGHPVKVPATRPRPKGVAGIMNVPSRAGILERAPESCDLPGVIDYRLVGQVGERHAASVDLTEFVANFLFFADDEEQARSVILRAADWFDSGCRWSAA